MLAIFSSSVAKAPKELDAAGSRSPSSKRNASELLESFIHAFPQAVSLQIEGASHLAYSHQGQDVLRPRSFAVKDEIFCLFEGMLGNLPSLRQQYGLSKSVHEVQLVIEAYKTLRDRAPYPANHVVGHLDGQFAFVIFDKTNGTIFVASDTSGRVPLYWGVTADGYLAFCNDAELLKGSCGKSLASFPGGCLFSSAADLRSYEHPLNRVTAVPTMEEDEIFGTTFKPLDLHLVMDLAHFWAYYSSIFKSPFLLTEASLWVDEGMTRPLNLGIRLYLYYSLPCIKGEC